MRKISPTVIGGNASTMRNCTTSVIQTNTGIRMSRMPGERVVDLGADDVRVRCRELEPDQERLEAAQQEERERGHAVEDADPLVVDGRDPGCCREDPGDRRRA